MRADLHVHTVFSDGSYSPDIIAKRAKECGIELISFTDHDSLEGIEEKRKAAKSAGLAFVVGWEISAYEECKIHVLGYNCKKGDAYDAFFAARKEGAVLRAQDMIEKANAFFRLSVTLAEVEEEHLKKDAPLHTMHVVKTFAKKLGKNEGFVYENYFDKGCVAYSELYRPTPEDAVDVIHALGGIASLAHPGKIRLPKAERDALIERLCRRGLDGIEAYHSDHTVEETEYFADLAKRKGLFKTGGSDFHREGGNRILGLPEFYPDEKLLAALNPSFGGG